MNTSGSTNEGSWSERAKAADALKDAGKAQRRFEAQRTNTKASLIERLDIAFTEGTGLPETTPYGQLVVCHMLKRDWELLRDEIKAALTQPDEPEAYKRGIERWAETGK